MATNYIFIQTISVLTFMYIIRLIYTHKLRIGNSWFLFLLGMGFLVLTVFPKTINILGYMTGSTSWLSNILFFLIMFLFIIIVHCTLMIKGLISRVKELGQQLALLNSEIDEKNSLHNRETQSA
ncbi:MAG: DUF2304 domain-containing protein [Candidatus Scalindua sp.]|nr:DUF2304 domain-containing protein [Candidatus Scalindua sp.]